MGASWTSKDLPDLRGKIAVVTGANGGLGLVTCRELARAGAEVILACRSPDKGEAAARAIREDVPSARLGVLPLDLERLQSVRDFATAVRGRHDRLDLLILNAGVIQMPFRRTEDGLELHMAVDCMAHFALTGLLFDRLQAASSARVVSVGTSSLFHRMGRVDPTDLHWKTRGYHRVQATLQAKLAFQAWTFELHERLVARGDTRLAALVAHPGLAESGVATAAAELEGASWREALLRLVGRVTNQSSDMGALPTLYAATSPDARSGDFIGPDGLLELHGHPIRLTPGRRLRDRALGRAIWAEAERVTGVRLLSE